MSPPSAGVRVSAFHAAKRGVHIRIMRLEPVPKRPAQHARGRARRAALHHVMLPVEKIRGITGIEREGLKPRKWRKNGARPLPPVACQIRNTEIARTAGEGSHRDSVPSARIEIPTMRGGRFTAPRVCALESAPGSARGAVPFGFARQLLPGPAKPN